MSAILFINAILKINLLPGSGIISSIHAKISPCTLLHQCFYHGMLKCMGSLFFADFKRIHLV